MCGIFAVINDKKNNASQTVLEGLKKLEYRGYDSWGIAVKTKNKLVVEKHIGKIGNAKTFLPLSNIGIGHTRWATHGGVFDKNAHPHLDCNNRFAVIHNGIIENYLEIKEKLIKKNHKFLSETDTEIIAHLIEEELKNKDYSIDDLIKKVFKSFKKLTGSNAVGILDAKTETIIACRNGSPLVVGIDKKNNQYFLSSDIPALLKHTKNVYFLNDNEAVVLNKNFFQVYDLIKEIPKKISFEKITLKSSSAEKEGYPHFLIKEIDEQKKTILKTAEKNIFLVEKSLKYFKKSEKIIFIGCGTAYHCALLAKYFFTKNGFESDAYQANEFSIFSNLINKKTLIVAISQSGETADTLLAVKSAKNKGAKIISIINNRGSTLERLSDFFIPIYTGPEISVVSTKDFTSQFIISYLLA
ncbi:MAG: glutamine--fructose-6-phosphate transaminase (isomerizing) [Patescibacteria group bacterium]|nr:glutamine--fructose-6-phosphate transaminase (isomerizing) [Patescibacteria group bacterium]